MIISYECDRESDFVETVKMKPAGSPQKNLPIKLLPKGMAGKWLWREGRCGKGRRQKVMGENMYVSKSCQNSAGGTAHAVCEHGSAEGN